MPQNPPATLDQLRRYQRLLTCGAGMTVTAVVLLAFTLEMISVVRAHLRDEQQTFLVDHSLVLGGIEASEASFRHGVISAQLAWRQESSVASKYVARFWANRDRIVLQPHQTLHSQLVFGGENPPASDEEIRRYLGLANDLAHTITTSSLLRGRNLTGYYFSAKRDLAALVPAPDATDADAALTDRRRLMDALAAGLTPLLSLEPTPWPIQPAVRWLPPSPNPLTGVTSIRLAAAAHDDGQPFAVLVTEYAPEVMLHPLTVDWFDGTFLIVTENSELVTAYSHHGVDDAVVQQILGSGEAIHPGNRLRVIHHNGIFSVATISDRLGNTNWTLVYAFSWRDIVAGIWPQLATSGLATAGIVAVLWMVLLVFNRRVFRPVYEQSQRVFDSEHLSRTVIETAPVGLGLIARGRGHPLLRSPLMVELASQVAGPPLLEMFAERYEAGWREVDAVRQEEVEVRTRDGREVTLSVSMAPSRYQGEAVLVAAFVDVTAKKQLEARLREARRAADEANAAKSAFLATMSHEIRTPLNAILGNLELLGRARLDARERDRLATIQASLGGLLSITSDVLDFSKIEAGAMVLERLPFSVLEVLERALLMFGPAAHAKGVALYLALGHASDQKMEGDPTRLGQIVQNLLGNALKFTGAGRVELGSSVEDGWLLITVTDTGIGMTSAQVSELFEAFGQANETINRRYGGTGLGLALCRRLAQAMGGTIEVSSEMNVGSCFSVRVPLHAVVCEDAAAFAMDGVVRRAVFVSAESAWQRLAIPHLRAWGLEVQGYERPSSVPNEVLDAADVVVVYGDMSGWRAEEENRLTEAGLPVLVGSREGPLRPLRQGRLIDVTSYSVRALRQGLRMALLGTAPEAVVEMDAGPLPERLAVVVAEDNTVNRQLLAEQLELLGCEARLADSGEAALCALSATPCDVLLTDLQMPGMSGYVLAEVARERWPELPVVAVTAQATVEEWHRCEAAGMAAVVMKPLSLSKLREVLRAVTGGDRELNLTGGEGHEGMLGGRALPKALRETLAREVSASLGQLDAAWEAGDAAQAAAELHGLQGMLGVYRKRSLADRCGRLEAAVRRLGTAALTANYVALAAVLRDATGEG
ncbi:ATP-binding protein [Burkholderia sp. JSH-S8]|nr:ATP-binding protein [Burkholderia sp. JSH-S8]